MFNLLKSDLYRLVRGKMLWVGLVVLLAVIVSGAGLVWFATTPEFAQLVNKQAQENVEQAGNAEGGAASSSGLRMEITSPNNADLAEHEAQMLNEKVIDSRTYSYGSTFMVGFLGLIVSVLAALVAAGDFDTGFVKNVLVGRRSRLFYFAEKLVVVALLCGAFLLAGMALSDAAYAIAGFSYEHVETIGEFWGWAMLSWLELTAYAYVVMLIVWATRSKAAGIVFAALIPTGFFESMLLSAAVGLAPAFPVINDLVKWLPLSTAKLLGAGGTDLFSTAGTAVAGMTVATQAALAFGVVAVVCAGLSLAAGRRRDV